MDGRLVGRLYRRLSGVMDCSSAAQTQGAENSGTRQLDLDSGSKENKKEKPVGFPLKYGVLVGLFF